MPAVRQKRSKLAPTSCQAASTIAAGTMPADVVDSFMALLSFADSAPRAYWLKVSNACPPFSTSTGTSPPALGVEVQDDVGADKMGNEKSDDVAPIFQAQAELGCGRRKCGVGSINHRYQQPH